MIRMRPTQLDQPVALGPKFGPPWLPKDLRGPQKGLSGPKRALLGALGVPQRSLKGPKHMVWMRPTQLDQPVAAWTKSDTGAQKGPFWTKTGPLPFPFEEQVIFIELDFCDLCILL